MTDDDDDDDVSNGPIIPCSIRFMPPVHATSARTPQLTLVFYDMRVSLRVERF